MKYAPTEHLFRMNQPSARLIEETERQFRDEQTRAFESWSEYRKHKAVIESALIRQLFKEEAIEAGVRQSVASLRTGLDERITALTTHDGRLAGPPIFQMKPGLNVISPPYDFGLNVALGSNLPMVYNSLGSGSFSVVATAIPGSTTSGSAGVGLFIVPSAPQKTLSIRPYFTWFYIYTCESHGPPTAHSSGSISANVSGRHQNGSSTPLPGRHQHLWSAGSDLWDDAHGEAQDAFRVSDSELVVSGFDFYTLSYTCQANADANRSALFSAVSYVQLHCRVPFLVVEEF